MNTINGYSSRSLWLTILLLIAFVHPNTLKGTSIISFQLYDLGSHEGEVYVQTMDALKLIVKGELFKPVNKRWY